MKHRIIISIVSLLLIATMVTGGYFAHKESVAKKVVVEETVTPTIISGNAKELAENLYKYVHQYNLDYELYYFPY